MGGCSFSAWRGDASIDVEMGIVVGEGDASANSEIVTHWEGTISPRKGETGKVVGEGSSRTVAVLFALYRLLVASLCVVLAP